MRTKSVGTLPSAPLFFVATALAACSGSPSLGEGEPVGASSASIINGTTASAYPEAALVDMSQSGSLLGGYCSGSLIAPQVVLTAGHCVKGEMSSMGTLLPDTWKITLPYNGNQKFTSTSAATYDWAVSDGTVDPTQHDIGLIFLSSAATVTPAQCPSLATAPIGAGMQVVNIGRIQDGNLSKSDLFVGAAVNVSDSTQYMYDYESQDIIEQGDSGGPDEVPGTTPHLIVAVNSGAGSTGATSTQVLARIDLLNAWIEQQIMAHGGPCAAPSSSSSGTTGSSSGTTSSSGSSSGSTSSSGSSSGSSSSGSGTSSSGSTSGGTTTNASSGGADGGDPSLNDWAKTQQATGCGCVAAGAGSRTPVGGVLLGLVAIGVGRARRSLRRRGQAPRA
jgi:hypothetical protein